MMRQKAIAVMTFLTVFVLLLLSIPVLAEDSKIIKVVPIKFCIVSDGVNVDTADDDDGRFNQDNRMAGLLWKSLIFSQAGVLFKPQGYIIVPDPDPPTPGPGPGEQGDIYDPSLDPATIREWLELKCDCNDAIGSDSKEKLVDILIREFVNGAGASSGNVGWSQRPPCTAVQRPTAKPTTNDPDSFTSLWPVFNPLLIPPFLNVDNFAETLTHEDGHALCLPHPPVNVDFRLMNATGFGNFVLNAAERANVRAEAQKISGTIDKNKKGERLPTPRPRSRVAVDALDDVPDVHIDIMEATAVKMADGDLALDMTLVGVLPHTISGLEYVFMVDLDNNTGTGGSPVVSFSHSFMGADLVAEITVSKTAGVPSVTVVAKRYQTGTFVPIIDPRIEADLVTLVAFAKGGAADFPVEDVVTFLLPSDLLPLTMAEGYRVGSFAYDSNTLELDEAPIVIGSITDFPEPTSILIDPVSGDPGDVVTVTGDYFNPHSTVDIFLGTQLVASVPTDGTGTFLGVQFTVPEPTYGADMDDTFIYDHESYEYVSPITAIDRTVVKVGEQYEKKSDAVIFQLPPPPTCPVGGIVVPVDKLALLAPWIALAILITFGSVSAVIWRKRRGTIRS